MPQNPQNVTPEQVQQLLNSLPQADKARIESVLQNKEATQKLLSTPQAQALMKNSAEENNLWMTLPKSFLQC